MPIRRRSSNERGPGTHRFNKLLQQRAPKKLASGEFLLYEHALRCFCARCGSLLNWDCPEDISYTETECCGLRYRLQPWTVQVSIEDVSSRPVLPKMEGSDYSDPEFDLRDGVVGSVDVSTTTSKPLSAAQQALSFAPPTTPPQVPRPPALKKPAPKKKKVRRCGICRQPGHTRRTCPEG